MICRAVCRRAARLGSFCGGRKPLSLLVAVVAHLGSKDRLLISAPFWPIYRQGADARGIRTERASLLFSRPLLPSEAPCASLLVRCSADRRGSVRSDEEVDGGSEPDAKQLKRSACNREGIRDAGGQRKEAKRDRKR